jgi:hypothetical protein
MSPTRIQIRPSHSRGKYQLPQAVDRLSHVEVGAARAGLRREAHEAYDFTHLAGSFILSEHQMSNTRNIR